MSLVEQELLTLPDHLSSPLVISGVRVTRSVVLHVCFVDRYLSFCTFSLANVLSALLRYTNSDCTFWYLQTLLLVKPEIFHKHWPITLFLVSSE